MQITAAELKLNLGKYLSIARTRDIFIVEDGQPIALLTHPYPDRVTLLNSFVGIAQAEGRTLDDIKKERLENT